MASLYKNENQSLWRIADKRYPLMDGYGAALMGGRWNSPGIPIIYAATSYSLAMLEKLVHLSRAKVPETQVFVQIKFSSDVAVEKVNSLDFFPNPNNFRESRKYGDQWAQDKRTVVLLVPSVVAGPNDYNALINPAHHDYGKLVVTEPQAVIWDDRLFRTSPG